MPPILLNPGPVNVSARVRDALNGPDICHRESEFFDLQDAIRARLLDAFDVSSDYTSVLLTGSGTAMVEAMITSAIPDGGRLLVVQNGTYGERIAKIAELHRIHRDIIACSPIQRPDLTAIGDRLGAERYDALAVVHHETTTGLINEIGPMAEICRRHGVPVLVDAVSALGGEPFDFAAWKPEAVACTSGKCVQGYPGLSFALVRRDFMKRMTGHPERSLYFHLPRHFAEQEKRSTPFTPAVQVAYALRAAIDELCDETVAVRIARYGRGTAIIRRGLTGLGLELLLPQELRSNTLTSVKLPLSVPYATLHDALKRSGFVIYAGQGVFAAHAFRVAAMGDVAEADYRRFVATLGAVVA